VFLHSWFRLTSILSMSKVPTSSNISKGQGTAVPHPKPKKDREYGIKKASLTCFPRWNLPLGDSPTVVSCSIFVLFIQWPGHHSRGSLPVEPPDLQSMAAPAGLPHHHQHHGIQLRRWYCLTLVSLSCGWSRAEYRRSVCGAEPHRTAMTPSSL
jgi:hypothetical protein